jgi:hypothetical protein
VDTSGDGRISYKELKNEIQAIRDAEDERYDE